MKEYTFKVLADTSEASSKVQGLEKQVKNIIKRINAETIKIRVDSSDISGLNKILDPLTSTHATNKFKQAKKNYEENFAFLKTPPISEKDVKENLNVIGKRLKQLQNNRLYESGFEGADDLKAEYEQLKADAQKYRNEILKLTNAEDIWKNLDTQARAGFSKEFKWNMKGIDIEAEIDLKMSNAEKAEAQLKELEQLAHADTSLQISIDGTQAKSEIESIQSMLDRLQEKKEIKIDIDSASLEDTVKTVGTLLTDAQKSLKSALDDILDNDALSKAKRKIAEEARELAKDAKKNEVKDKTEDEESDTVGTVERIKEIKKAHDELPTKETTITINVDGNALSGLQDINKELRKVVNNKELTIDLKVNAESLGSLSNMLTGVIVGKNGNGVESAIDSNLKYLAEHASDDSGEGYFIFDTKNGKTSDVRRSNIGAVSKKEKEKLYKDFSDIKNKTSAAFIHSHPEFWNQAFSPSDISGAIRRYDKDMARYAGTMTTTGGMLIDMSRFQEGGAERFRSDYETYFDKIFGYSVGDLYGLLDQNMGNLLGESIDRMAMAVPESHRSDFHKGLNDIFSKMSLDKRNKLIGSEYEDYITQITDTGAKHLQSIIPNISQSQIDDFYTVASQNLDDFYYQIAEVPLQEFLTKRLGKTEDNTYTVNGQSAIKQISRRDLDHYGLRAFTGEIEEKASTTPSIEIKIDADKAKADVAEIQKAIDSLPPSKEIIIDFKVNDDGLKSIVDAVGEQIATGVTTESIGKATEAVVEKQVEDISKKVVEDASKKSKKKQTKKNEEVVKTNIDKTLQYLSKHAGDNQGSGYFAFDAKTGEASNIRRTKSAEKIPKQSITKLINAYPNLNNSKSGVLMRSDPYSTVAFSNWYNEAKKRLEGDITSGWDAYKNKGFRYSGKITKKDAMLLDYSKFTDEGFEQFRKDYLKDATEAKSASIFEQLALVGVKKEEQFDYLAKELSKAAGADNEALRGLMRSGLLGLSTQSDFQNLSSKDSRARIVDMARTMLQNVHKGQGITDFDYDAYTKLVNDKLDYVAEQAVDVRKRNFLQGALGKGSKYTKNNWSAIKYSTIEDLNKNGLKALGLTQKSASTPTTTTTTEVDVKTDKADSKIKETKQNIESIPEKKETTITADVSDFQKKEQILHYDKNGNPVVMTQDIPTVKLADGKTQPARDIVKEYEDYKKKRAEEETGFVLVDSTDKPVSALDSEAEAMKRIKEAAEQAASGKQAFVGANAKVLESAHESAAALGVEADAFERLAKASGQQKTEVENPPVTPEQKAKQDEEERQEKINQQRQQYFDMLAKSIQKDFSTHPSAKEVSGRISGGSFHLSELESKLREYGALKREFQELTSDNGDLGIQTSIKNTGASLKAEIETIIKEGKHVPAYVENMRNLLNTTVTEIDPKNYEKSAEAINKVNRALLAGNQNMISGSTGKMRDKIQKYINQNNAMDSQYRARLYGMLNSINDDSSVRHITEISAAFDNLKAEMGAAGQTGKSFWNTFTERIKTGSAQFLATYFGIQDVIRYAQKAVQAINEVDTALIELKKVSNASDFEIADALKVSEATAKDLGATVSDTVSATADWARLGYNLPEAEELGKVATLYKNVGDGIDINQANESLISTLQGFQMEAGDSMEIVDKFNEVANNFPIDSGGIGEALQRSAASFNAAHTDLSKSIALVTTTNAVVQDPDVVGTMWKTVSARLRGAKTE